MINILLFWGDKLHWISNVKSAYKEFSSSGKQSGNDFFKFRWDNITSLHLNNICTVMVKNMARHLICP